MKEVGFRTCGDITQAYCFIRIQSLTLAHTDCTDLQTCSVTRGSSHSAMQQPSAKSDEHPSHESQRMINHPSPGTTRRGRIRW